MAAGAFELPPERWQRLRSLMDEGLALAPADRPAWLDALAPAEPDLAPHLRGLLDEHAPTVGALPRVAGRAAPAPGSVGPYRLIRLLGEGGMGSVWLAERTDMLQARQVALKLPHLAAPSAGLKERLAREREILATLQHPHIAALYDAGVADDGQPWLALEHVQGEPIDRYCAAHGLDVPARLRVFGQVLAAVAHAHSRLVVHRDLKPANVLVTAEGQARLLDFGIAKLLQEGTAPETQLTRESGRALTLDYAAPEQIRGEPLGTAADVYALGVLLCELLSGRRPYQLPRGSRAALEEAILDADPLPPSRLAEGPALRRALRGDLDTIVLKALKKAPDERYASAQAMADDIARHLRHEPVLARPDGRRYRLGRFLRRHRAGVAAAGAVATALVGGTTVALWQGHQARLERANAEQVKQFIAGLLRDASPYQRPGGGPVTALELLQGADKRLAQATDLPAQVQAELAGIVVEGLLSMGDNASAGAAASAALAQSARALGSTHPLTLHLRAQQVQTLRLAGRSQEAVVLNDALLPALRALPDPPTHTLMVVLMMRGLLAMDAGRHADAVTAAQELQRESTARQGERHSDTLAATSLLTQALLAMRRFDEARSSGRQALSLAVALYGEGAPHPRVMEARNAYGRALAAAGQLREGVPLIERSAEDAVVILGPEHLITGYYAQNAVDPLITLGELQRAEAAAERSVTAITRSAPAGSVARGVALSLRGQLRLAQRRGTEALPDLRQALEILQAAVGPTHEYTRAARVALAHTLALRGQSAEALPVVDELLAAPPEAPLPPWLATWAQTVRARLDRLAGHPEAAVQRLSPLVPRQDDSARGRREHAQAMAELGLSQLARRDPAAADTLDGAVRAFAALQSRPTPAALEAAAALAQARRSPS